MTPAAITIFCVLGLALLLSLVVFFGEKFRTFKARK